MCQGLLFHILFKANHRFRNKVTGEGGSMGLAAYQPVVRPSTLVPVGVHFVRHFFLCQSRRLRTRTGASERSDLCCLSSTAERLLSLARQAPECSGSGLGLQGLLLGYQLGCLFPSEWTRMDHKLLTAPHLGWPQQTEAPNKVPSNLPVEHTQTGVLATNRS